jgi:hypothetical protein
VQLDTNSLSNEQLAVLAARLTSELSRRLLEQAAVADPAEPLVDVPTLARHLNVKMSWVRTEEPAGRIPSVHIGRYVKFRLSEALAVLARKET